MPSIISSILSEYQRYKKLAEDAIAQVSDTELNQAIGDDNNSIAVVMTHVSGNLRSRFTDFLTSDGEKPWRHRDEEFADTPRPRAELLAHWEQGWSVVLATLGGLADDRLADQVTIRRQPMPVADALHRSLAHTSYHVGQIVYIARALRGAAWTSLSIPRGQSDAFNKGTAR
jgi:uncharacterized damage-inducible protein DinB